MHASILVSGSIEHNVRSARIGFERIGGVCRDAERRQVRQKLTSGKRRSLRAFRFATGLGIVIPPAQQPMLAIVNWCRPVARTAVFHPGRTFCAGKAALVDFHLSPVWLTLKTLRSFAAAR